MSVELLLLRHGHAAINAPAWDDRGDFGRRLSGRGERQSTQVAQWLMSNRLEPDAIICSSAERTQGTAAAVCIAANMALSMIDLEDSIYEARVQNLIDVVCRTPNEVKRLLFIGHNPGLELLAKKLAGHLPLSTTGELMPPATLVHIALEGGWAEAAQAKAHCRNIFRADSF